VSRQQGSPRPAVQDDDRFEGPSGPAKERELVARTPRRGVPAPTGTRTPAPTRIRTLAATGRRSSAPGAVAQRTTTARPTLRGVAGCVATGGAGIATFTHPSTPMIVISLLTMVLTALSDPRVLGTIALCWCTMRGSSPGPAGELLVEHARVVTGKRS
jgi:hypothetical protein